MRKRSAETKLRQGAGREARARMKPATFPWQKEDRDRLDLILIGPNVGHCHAYIVRHEGRGQWRGYIAWCWTIDFIGGTHERGWADRSHLAKRQVESKIKELCGETLP
jgi:hypothetical protein